MKAAVVVVEGGGGVVDGRGTLTTDGNERQPRARAAVQTYLYTHRCAHKFGDATKKQKAAAKGKQTLGFLGL